MLLVKVTDVRTVIEKEKPCLAVSAHLVRILQNSGADSNNSGFEAVRWYNQPVSELQLLPSKEKKLGFVGYPEGVAPLLIVDDWDLYLVWNGPVLFVFLFYDTGLILSELV